jgi:hypothetical protein
MPDPEPSGCESHGGKKVSGELVEAGGDAAEVLKFVEEAFDQISLAIEGMVDRPLVLAGLEGRNVRSGAMIGDEVDHRLGIVSTIGDGIGSRLQTLEQSRHGGLVGSLTRGQQKADRQAVGINHGMELGAQSSTRTADGVIRAPFFPPPACWCARTIEESIR